ncbi:MAG: glutaredoxin/malate transporter fusion protein [Solirubrobacterales bacterium]|nr:glutaredoxin/malate transporter fusion protein [Solirubrobacterales bacterium]
MFSVNNSVFSFPDPVNEVSARLVAGGVVALSALTIALDAPWLTLPIAYGFLARVASGPTLSPLGQLVTHVIVPRLALTPRPVPGPPKRFAQAIGATLSVTAAVLALALDLRTAAYALLGVLIAAATLESVFGLCLGCRMFALLMRIGAIPQDVCERCADITRELPERA